MRISHDDGNDIFDNDANLSVGSDIRTCYLLYLSWEHSGAFYWKKERTVFTVRDRSGKAEHYVEI